MIFPKSKIGYKTKTNQSISVIIFFFDDGIEKKEKKLRFVSLGPVDFEIIKSWIHTYKHTHIRTHHYIRTNSKNGIFWFQTSQNIFLSWFGRNWFFNDYKASSVRKQYNTRINRTISWRFRKDVWTITEDCDFSRIVLMKTKNLSPGKCQKVLYFLRYSHIKDTLKKTWKNVTFNYS